MTTDDQQTIADLRIQLGATLWSLATEKETNKALDEMIGSLTTHADALSGLLQEAYQLIEYENPAWSANLLNRMEGATDAYDNFIREA